MLYNVFSIVATANFTLLISICVNRGKSDMHYTAPLGPVHTEVGLLGRWDEFFRAFTWENLVLAAGMCFVT